jgi:hypothetical protein
MNLDLMFLIVWSSALAAVLGAALCFAASPWIARVTRVDFALVAAPLVAVILLGSFEVKKSVLDFVALFGFGVLGWLMKKAQWPRAPLLVGFVLTDPIERNFWLAYQLHGWSWLHRPIVLGLIAVVVVHVGLTLRRAVAASGARRATGPAAPAGAAPSAPRLPGSRLDLDLLLALGATVVLAAAIARSFDLAPDSRLVPLLAAIPGLVAALVLTAAGLRGGRAGTPWPPRGEVTQLALLGAGIAAMPLAGFLPALAAYLLAMLWTRTRMRLAAVPYAGAITAAAHGLSKAFNLPLP